MILLTQTSDVTSPTPSCPKLASPRHGFLGAAGHPDLHLAEVHRKTTGKSWENHGKTGKPWENLGKPWENHGKTGKPWENPWENHGKTGKPWENRGKTMGKPENHGKTMGKPWENGALPKVGMKNITSSTGMTFQIH